MKRTMLLVLIASGLLAGCGEKTPKCNSDDAKNLVVDIARKTIEKSMTLDKDVRISVENVRTISHESGLDVYQCAADLTFTKPELKDSLPITYRIQKTDEGKGQFYINISGL
ncbi:hypothetical protein CVQ47_003034 [Salmonella enterica subsp. enterica serovar Javiana]|uniref:Lipoprotein n=1 Tax=Salmonella enterica TaxID=28901 RepID=A0A623NKD2_SALER|nr:hypothetical protein [Citrobacter braakii]EAB4492553.1 hypothetical protein [Salmonella enterica]ECB9331795.1 hypothetical protein [Salmonella enterica subsp. enterica serovar Javiana]EAB5063079.1 hypothetical protein [Salmonella enterica]EAM4147257.1 hypothetical protein [Salmonella enterica]EAM4170226.1 hypothetical protein [Salmonella enterica]